MFFEVLFIVWPVLVVSCRGGNPLLFLPSLHQHTGHIMKVAQGVILFARKENLNILLTILECIMSLNMLINSFLITRHVYIAIILLVSKYSHTKYLQYLLDILKSFKITIVVVRFFQIYSPS